MSAAVADSARQRVANNSFAQPICWQAHGAYPVKGFDGTIEIREAGLESVAPFVAPPRAQPVSSPGSANRVLPAKPSIAVLPFANLSNDPEQAYFADGMMEEITTALSRIRSIFVIASGSTQSLRGKTSAPQEIGHQLGVRYILEGSVRKASNRVRIGVTLYRITSIVDQLRRYTLSLLDMPRHSRNRAAVIWNPCAISSAPGFQLALE
jgi:TolB-like protein